MNPMFVYKWYTKKGYYKGDLEVLSDFSLSTQINTAGSAISIKVRSSLAEETITSIQEFLIDESANRIITENNEKIIVESRVSFEDLANYTYLVDENGNFIVDENGNKILTDIEYTSSKMVGLGDIVRVWRFDEYNVDGIQVFEGLVSQWENSFNSNTTDVNVMSLGAKTDHHLVEILPNTAIVSNEKVDDSVTIYSSDPMSLRWLTPPNDITAIAQLFTVTSNASLYSVDLWFEKVSAGSPTPDGTAEVAIYRNSIVGTPTLLASSPVNIQDRAMGKLSVSFSSEVRLVTGTTYSLVVSNTGSGSYNIGIDSTRTYAQNAYTYSNSAGWSSPETYGLTLNIYTSTGSVDNSFLSVDPSDIYRSLLDLYSNTGEKITYDSDSVKTTGTKVSYKFRFTKYLEAISKCSELSPSNWWWWIDPSNTKAYLKPMAGSAHHTFIYSRHLTDIKIGYSLEKLINISYLSGAEVSGTNLLRSYSDPHSLDKYGSWLNTKSDNRVTLEDTADILNKSNVDQWKEPKFKSEISIASSVYDIYSIKVGQMIGFRSFNELIDNLIMQVVAIEYYKDSASISLSMLPPDISKRVEDIRRNLEKEQTANNE